MVIREYEVIKPIKARKGIVGQLTSNLNGRTYAGGAEQIELLDGINFEDVWTEYFRHQGFTDNTEKIRNYLGSAEKVHHLTSQF